MSAGHGEMYNGAPCARGHVAKYATTGNCVECAKAYQRDRRANPQVNAQRRSHYARNANRLRAISRDYQAAHKEGTRQAKRRNRGLPEPTRPCPEVCENCGRPPGKKSLALDHCHATGRFRGWLCGSCNITLGHMKDSPALLRSLAVYLEST